MLIFFAHKMIYAMFVLFHIRNFVKFILNFKRSTIINYFLILIENDFQKFVDGYDYFNKKKSQTLS